MILRVFNFRISNIHKHTYHFQRSKIRLMIFSTSFPCGNVVYDFYDAIDIWDGCERGGGGRGRDHPTPRSSSSKFVRGGLTPPAAAASLQKPRGGVTPPRRSSSSWNLGRGGLTPPTAAAVEGGVNPPRRRSPTCIRSFLFVPVLENTSFYF